MFTVQICTVICTFSSKHEKKMFAVRENIEIDLDSEYNEAKDCGLFRTIHTIVALLAFLLPYVHTLSRLCSMVQSSTCSAINVIIVVYLHKLCTVTIAERLQLLGLKKMVQAVQISQKETNSKSSY